MVASVRKESKMRVHPHRIPTPMSHSHPERTQKSAMPRRSESATITVSQSSFRRCKSQELGSHSRSCPIRIDDESVLTSVSCTWDGSFPPSHATECRLPMLGPRDGRSAEKEALLRAANYERRGYLQPWLRMDKEALVRKQARGALKSEGLKSEGRSVAS